jgi:hypothetical protein
MSDTVQQGLSEEFMLPVRAGLKPPEMREALASTSDEVARLSRKPLAGSLRELRKMPEASPEDSRCVATPPDTGPKRALTLEG